MKKRIFALLLIAAMSFSLLAGCAGQGSGTPGTENTPSDPSFHVDLAKFYDEIMAAAGEAPFMTDLAAADEMLENIYPGLKDIETKQLVAYAPAITAVALEFAFVETASAADAAAVKAIFQARIDTQVSNHHNYPMVIEAWENSAEIVVIDNFVCLFVCEEKDGMIEALRTGTKVPAWGSTPEDGYEDETGGDVVIEYPEFDPDADTPAAGFDDNFSATMPGLDDGFGVTPEQPAPSEQPTPSEQPSESVPAAGSIDLGAFFEELYNTLYPLDSEGYATGPAVDDWAAIDPVPELLNNYYPGLFDLELKQAHVYIPMMSAVAYEVTLIEAASAADAETVKACLQARIDTQIGNHHNYPMVIEAWQTSARIVSNGCYVMLAVGDNADAYADAFRALF